MGEIKSKGQEGIKELQENSEKTTDFANRMIEQASEINSIVKSIDLRDSDDRKIVENVSSNYERDFDTAFDENVSSAKDQLKEMGQEISEQMDEEKDNVLEGSRKLEQSEQVSDIGKGSAETGKKQLEESAKEYEAISSEAKNTVEDIDKTISDLKNDLKSMWR